MTPTITVRCWVCAEHVPAVKIGKQDVQLKTHEEPDTTARCTGSLAIQPLPEAK